MRSVLAAPAQQRLAPRDERGEDDVADVGLGGEHPSERRRVDAQDLTRLRSPARAGRSAAR